MKVSIPLAIDSLEYYLWGVVLEARNTKKIQNITYLRITSNMLWERDVKII